LENADKINRKTRVEGNGAHPEETSREARGFGPELVKVISLGRAPLSSGCGA
jgi:hypothetical protein